MKFSTEKLTAALKQIAESEKSGTSRQAPEQAFGTVVTIKNRKISSEVSDFLKERREYIARSKNIDLGKF